MHLESNVMNKNNNSVKYVLTALVILTLSAFIPAIAYAAKPSTVSADFTFVVTPTGSKTAGSNTILDINDIITFSSGVEGTSTCVGQFIIHNAEGTGNFNAKCTFTGTVPGGSGPGTMSVSFEGHSVGSSYVAYETWSSGTGGLAGIQAQGPVVGEFTSATTGFGTKTMHVQFN